ncbi:hypothetical protein FRC02_008749 [Tulasnella sp. 418]|nr:hypothetical protein FRC02_008749 [Tulasnella sp. 418]
MSRYEGEEMVQSFFFDWNPSNNPNPAPITAQCDTLKISWKRGSATGPDPIPPHRLLIFTSTDIAPLVIPFGSGYTYDLSIPFPPDTQYQICMFDSEGNTGGCQAIYSVYQNPLGASCMNATFPRPMPVTSSSSQYGWPPQCSELVLDELGGTPPYTFMALPALRAPIVIKNIGADGIRWRIPYDYATPFFVQMTDSGGRSWSYGPLHAGLGDDTTCFNYKNTGPARGPTVSLPAVIGIAIGCLIAGALICYLASMFWPSRWRRRGGIDTVYSSVNGSKLQPTPFQISPLRDQNNHNPTSYNDPYRALPTHGDDHERYPLAPVPEQGADYYDENAYSTNRRSRYGDGTIGARSVLHNSNPISPTAPQSEYGTRYGRDLARGSVYGDHVGSDRQSYLGEQSESSRSVHTKSMYGGPGPAAGSHVFVVHHDGSGAPVTIFTDQGSEVVELPPLYSGNFAASENQPVAESSTLLRGSSVTSVRRQLPNPPKAAPR